MEPVDSGEPLERVEVTAPTPESLGLVLAGAAVPHGVPKAHGSLARVIGIGVDVCSIDRMRATLARTPRFATRIFTEDERAYADGFAAPAGAYAARFAAKEAAMKAMGVGIEDVPFNAIELVRAASGEPSIVLHGRAALKAEERGIATMRVSISHDAGVAVAFVVAVG